MRWRQKERKKISNKRKREQTGFSPEVSQRHKNQCRVLSVALRISQWGGLGKSKRRQRGKKKRKGKEEGAPKED